MTLLSKILLSLVYLFGFIVSVFIITSLRGSKNPSNRVYMGIFSLYGIAFAILCAVTWTI
jgi:hypothetical protein